MQRLRKKGTKDVHLPHKSSILSGLQYKVDENPPWITTVLLGFQHYLTLIGSGLAIPDIVAGTICAKGTPEETHVKAVLFGNMVFASGLCTLVQSYIGTRLPIVQCVAFSYVVPMLAMRKLDRWTCPDYSDPGFQSNATLNGTFHQDSNDDEPFYVLQMNQLIGSIMAAAVLEIAIGASGMIGLLLRFIGPLTVAPTIILIGLSVAEYAFGLAGKHWGIAAAYASAAVYMANIPVWGIHVTIRTVVLIILLSEIVPVFEFKSPFQRKSDKKSEFVMHKIYSVILTVCFMWLLCYILTITGVFPNDTTSYGYEARTDLRLGVISKSSWFRFPYPGNWGKPAFSSAIFVAMIAGVITSVIESIGDYYTCARIAGAHPPPAHAINRGILVEGIDCVLSAAVGIGYGVTSCSQNIGVISLTKVGSRRVALMAGVIMMVFGCLSKINALAMSMPDPIIGASCLVLFGVLTAVGASNLQYVNLNSSRNLLVFGISLFIGLGFPAWMVKNSNLISTGNENIDQVLNALLANTMFMGAFSALILDNVIPGTLEDRGILSWRETPDQTEEEKQELKDSRIDLKTYDLPFVTKYIRRWKYTKYIPFLPTFGTRDEAKVHLAEAEVVFSPDNDGNVTLENNVEDIDEIKRS